MGWWRRSNTATAPHEGLPPIRADLMPLPDKELVEAVIENDRVAYAVRAQLAEREALIDSVLNIHGRGRGSDQQH